MDKRLIVVAAGILVFLGCGWILKQAAREPTKVDPNAKVTKQNFEGITRGMTKAEVEAIFGKPTMTSAHDNCSAWGDDAKDEEIAAVWYDEQGRVRLKAWLRQE